MLLLRLVRYAHTCTESMRQWTANVCVCVSLVGFSVHLKVHP